MSYQALYRVYRPQRFSDIVGQETITQTLRRAIAEDKKSHAYLFTGPRGTGKTSAAKIFAKAINCPHAQDGEPCNECDICQQITSGALNDVIEIDAASNNGVDEIRDIREKANYAPTQADYKVYIIDEIHMLSQGAFNALLKTLEEPPQNVVFILATTEPHKIPATIISRTQRFDFKRIKEEDMIKRMAYILEKEQVDYEAEVLKLIAQNAEGGMRDALSILDQTLSFSQGKLSTEDATQVTGALTQDLLQAYMESIRDQSTQDGLKVLQSILQEGKDPGRFTEDIILYCRDLLVYQLNPGDQDLLKRAQTTEDFSQLAGDMEEDVLYQVITVFNETQQELRLSNHAPVYLEVATIRLTQLAQAQQVSSQVSAGSDQVLALQDQVAQLQDQVKQLTAGTPAPKSEPPQKTGRPKKSAGSPAPFKANRAQVFSVLEEATRQDLTKIQDLWPDLLNALSTTSRAMTRASKPVAASPTGAVISFEYDILCERATQDQNLQTEIKTYLEKVSGQAPQLVYVTEAQWPSLRQEFIDQIKSAPSKSGPAHDIIQEADQDQEEASQDANEIVDQAVQLFGQENVTIKDE